ncbi:cobalt ABC transporter [Bifidobacterium hapali]|uniref:Cobalt ABC transporter n=1 Tax=Bifidobacterium hapali TaxID=1630172 RepID=A0A261G5T0_9BIFI|nr:energy-coupling factor transporter ATPase [Bifidobacterium hapali]OZG66366.1 cobalt ABC transporter [Bifidobacterium hapali]
MIDAAILTDIRFSYDGGASWALNEVNLTIHAGEYVCLTGPNGSGKSTLARLIAGLSAPDAGHITLLGHDVFNSDGDAGANPAEYRAARRNIGAVFQNPEDQLVTTISEDDVAFGPENLGTDRSEIGRRIDESLTQVDMTAHRYDDPTRMSGGQQQRIAIAGMLAMHPSMLILDEPTAMLDPVARAEVMRILDELHAHGTTIVHVTHHHDEAMRADRIIHMVNGNIVNVDNRNDDNRNGIVPFTRWSETGIMPSREKSLEDEMYRQEHAHEPHNHDSDESHILELSEHTIAADSPIAAQPTQSAHHHVHSTQIQHTQQSLQPAIVIDHLTYQYPGSDAPAICDLSLTVNAGETVAIMGANGAGKSTLARLICALDQPNEGSITVANIPVATDQHTHNSQHRRSPRMLNRKQRETLRRTVGFVMQHPERQLFADTVADDVAYGPRNQRLNETEISARVHDALQLLHIEHLADRSPFSLSGGQQRLVAIAGVIACRPSILVMDEPTASLDETATARIHELIQTLHKQGVTVLIVTHSLDEAHAVADRIITIGTAIGTQATAGNRHKHTAVPNATVHEMKAETNIPEANTVHSHRSNIVTQLDPRAKMVTFLVLMFTAFAINTPAQLALGAIMVGAIIAAGRLNPLRLLASVHMFLAMFIVMGALNIFFVRTGNTLIQLGPIPITDDGITIAILYALRFALVIILGAILMQTTTPTELTDGFGSLLSPLRHLGMHTQEIALVMSLALRFLPTLGAEAKAIADAQAARGGSIETGSLTARLQAMTALCVPMFAGAIRHADNLSLALDARCYEEGIHRTRWHALHVKPVDIMFCAITGTYVVGLVVLGLL